MEKSQKISSNSGIYLKLDNVLNENVCLKRQF